MRDSDVRRVLLERLKTADANAKEALLLEELGVCRGTARVDLAVVNGLLKAYEIKSERDTLVRLEDQATIYSRVFDTVTLVVAQKHLDAAKSIIPPWWGIELAIPDEASSVILKTSRDEGVNPAVDPYCLVQLLWREEMLSLLEQLLAPQSYQAKSKRVLEEHLASALSLQDLKKVVRCTLRNRKGWRAASQQRSSGEKFPPSSMLSSSPFRYARTRSLRYSYRPN